MFDAIVQGLIQGLTEFLPVSSSGHLVLAQHLFGFSDLDPAFNVFVQGGTVISVLFYYRTRLISLTKKYFWLLILATIPAGLAGVVLGDYVDQLFSSLSGAALGFFLTTIVVWLTKHLDSNKLAKLDHKVAIKVGLAQAFAILPGLSRSGTTITAGLASGLNSEESFDFSFLMSVPIIAGAAALGSRHIVWDVSMTPSYLVGFLVASIVGYFTLSLLAKIMKQGKFYNFAPYTLFLGIISLYLSTR